jgi:hypothetical protein
MHRNGLLVAGHGCFGRWQSSHATFVDCSLIYLIFVVHTAPDAWRLHVRHVHVMPRVRDGHLQRLVEPDAQCLQTRIWRRI